MDVMCQKKSIYLWVLEIVGLLGLLALILWLSLRPKSPTVTVVDLSVPPIDNSSSSAADDDDENDGLSYTIEIDNPNRDSTIYFDDILLMFFFGQDTAATDRISAFKLDKVSKNRNRVKADARLWKALRSAISKNSTAPVKVDFSTRYRIKTMGLKSKRHEIKLQGDVQLGKDGKIFGKKKKIKLKHASKKSRVKAFHSHKKMC
ncbi:protein NDR1-like [Melia azedarach]|uniref:Protein NDR1-like n=1 Tax=Melia azedarach TaxID=155640 RepID=A0ACC1WVH8_MELAZ|nr:protein NDR1-like [Melia azedarach]